MDELPYIQLRMSLHHTELCHAEENAPHSAHKKLIFIKKKKSKNNFQRNNLQKYANKPTNETSHHLASQDEVSDLRVLSKMTSSGAMFISGICFL